MQEAQSWRELLRTLIRDTDEKQRLVSTLGITPLTLTRWINGSSDPRPQNIRQLLNALPQHRSRLYELLQKEPGLIDFMRPGAFAEIPRSIPGDFYTRVLELYASTNRHARFWTLSTTILQQLLQHLDKEQRGLYTAIIRCMPPSGPQQKVRSLRESTGLGTPPWTENVEQNAIFSGAESLMGNAVTLCQPIIIQNYDRESSPFAMPQRDFEKSSVLFPVLYAGRVAGVLVVASTQTHFFTPTYRIELVQSYADLVALAFEQEDFYTTEQIALEVMPSYKEQRKYFRQYQEMVTETLTREGPRFINHNEASMLVWQKLEDRLLHLSVVAGVQ